jgi:hypothetical protein
VAHSDISKGDTDRSLHEKKKQQPHTSISRIKNINFVSLYGFCSNIRVIFSYHLPCMPHRSHDNGGQFVFPLQDIPAVHISFFLNVHCLTIKNIHSVWSLDISSLKSIKITEGTQLV